MSRDPSAEFEAAAPKQGARALWRWLERNEVAQEFWDFYVAAIRQGESFNQFWKVWSAPYDDLPPKTQNTKTAVDARFNSLVAALSRDDAA